MLGNRTCTLMEHHPMILPIPGYQISYDLEHPVLEGDQTSQPCCNSLTELNILKLDPKLDHGSDTQMGSLIRSYQVMRTLCNIYVICCARYTTCPYIHRLSPYVLGTLRASVGTYWIPHIWGPRIPPYQTLQIGVQNRGPNQGSKIGYFWDPKYKVLYTYARA